MKHKLYGTLLCVTLTTAAWTPVTVWAGHDDDEVEITIIHTGDFHGHLVPRPNMRSDGDGRMEGGLARIAYKIKSIREEEKHTLYFHTGDTIQGSAEALYTRGQALVDVVDMMKPDVYAPGNWEFVYGKARFVEFFGDGTGKDGSGNRWGTVSANVRHAPAAGASCTSGEYVVPPYRIIEKAGLKIGIIGMTTDRGPQVVGSAVTAGLCYLSSAPGTSGTPDVSQVEAELQSLIAKLRNEEKVDLLFMVSELGLANNSLLAERNDGLDAVFSSDMHEETRRAVVVQTPSGGSTILVEEGQDGTMMGKLEIEFDKKKKRIKEWDWKAYTVTEDWKEDRYVARKVADVRRPFLSGSFVEQVNPFNGAVLKTPIDTTIGHTDVALHRSNFAHEHMPGAVEGTSHNFLSDAFRGVAGTNIGAIRGFRYGTHVTPGAVKLEDLYHYMPIGAQIARGTIRGQGLKNQIENPADGSFNADPRRWTGGWLFGFSGISFDIDLYLPRGTRASNVQVNGVPLDTTANYSYASYWYGSDPGLINRVPASNIEVAVHNPADGKALFVPVAEHGNYEPMDGTEIVWQYLRESLGGRLTSLEGPRVNLLRALPAPVFYNYEVQPLRGAQ